MIKICISILYSYWPLQALCLKILFRLVLICPSHSSASNMNFGSLNSQAPVHMQNNTSNVFVMGGHLCHAFDGFL